APACAAPLLPEARDRARKADRDGAVEQADVDAELERIGRGHAEELSLDELPLDIAPLLRRVPGAVRREPYRRVGVDTLRRHSVHELRCLPALREADRSQAALDERRIHAGRLTERGRPEAELGVEQWWVPQRHGALGARR